MVFGDDLLLPFGTRGIRFVTPDAGTEVLLSDLDIGIIRVCLAWAMASLAGESLVLKLHQLVHLIRVTLLTGFLSCKNRFARLQLDQRGSSIPAILSKRRRGQKVAGDAIAGDDPNGQQQQANRLRWHFESFHAVRIGP